MGISDQLGTFERLAEEQASSQMSPRLVAFLDEVWTRKDDPTLDIYQLYVGGRPHTPVDADEKLALSPGDRTLVVDFIARLGQIQTANGVGRMNQAWGWAAYDLSGWGAPPELPELAVWASRNKYDFVLHDVGCSFFHFRSGESPARRVYLNVLPEHRATVQAHIVENVVNVVDDVTNSKVLGPLGLGHDTIVVYARTEIAVDQVLASVAAYQAGAGQQAHFGLESIRIARPVTRHGTQSLIGVSVAVEPKDELKQAMRQGSFGAVWEALIRRALVSGSAGKAAYYKAVLRLMRSFEMDPMRPEM